MFRGGIGVRIFGIRRRRRGPRSAHTDAAETARHSARHSPRSLRNYRYKRIMKRMCISFAYRLRALCLFSARVTKLLSGYDPGFLLATAVMYTRWRPHEPTMTTDGPRVRRRRVPSATAPHYLYLVSHKQNSHKDAGSLSHAYSTQHRRTHNTCIRSYRAWLRLEDAALEGTPAVEVLLRFLHEQVVLGLLDFGGASSVLDERLRAYGLRQERKSPGLRRWHTG